MHSLWLPVVRRTDVPDPVGDAKQAVENEDSQKMFWLPATKCLSLRCGHKNSVAYNEADPIVVASHPLFLLVFLLPSRFKSTR